MNSLCKFCRFPFLEEPEMSSIENAILFLKEQVNIYVIPVKDM